MHAAAGAGELRIRAVGDAERGRLPALGCRSQPVAASSGRVAVSMNDRSPTDADAAASPDLLRARQRWRELVQRELPLAAASRPDWPIRVDHCFARVILDAVCGRPWREVVAAPAWRNLDGVMLDAAIALAAAILDGSADLQALDAQSLAWRGKAPKTLTRARHRVV